MKKLFLLIWFVFIMIMIYFGLDSITGERNVVWDAVSNGFEELSMWVYKHLR